ncbi:peptide N-acetyl-beta-D-glucosaminyl asparaginase amidase A-domain-containing protein [Pisolithus marmoratus]|nr:peptide N-acetyl-beta-D-glucosaminyl asparaginase amidase A-domain-containing protein [Pisolithus marmoratus]
MLPGWKFVETVLAAVPLIGAQVLVDFQVAQPPPVPGDAKTCTIKILERTFGNSYYDPEIVSYRVHPDGLTARRPDCGTAGSWAAVTLNFTVTSNGTQYDRLGVFTFQNTEIWRTSTPEPTPDGIIWTYTKDVTRYIPLFAEPGTFLLELDNIVTSTLTGEYATTLYATFYEASENYPTAGQSNLIVPISTMSDTLANDASVPPAFSLNVTLPQNTVEIYAELYASGNGKEEFWYYNTADEYFNDLPPGTTYGGGPFREVRLLVDGQLAGVAFPYAVIFTGGINPAVWRPITAYGAIDLPTYFLDLTPFAPIFADGLPHNVTIDVASAEVDHTVNQNWYVSGLLQVVTDSSGKRTTGQMVTYNAQPYATTQTYGSTDANDVNVTVNAQRQIYIESIVVSGSGHSNHVIFEQNLAYTNTQWYLNGTYTQLVPAPFILGSDIAERQLATGYFTSSTAGNFGSGSNNNTCSYVDSKHNTYYRLVDAAMNEIVYDQESGSLASSSPGTPWPVTPCSFSVPPARLPGGKHFGN